MGNCSSTKNTSNYTNVNGNSKVEYSKAQASAVSQAQNITNLPVRRNSKKKDNQFTPISKMSILQGK